MRRLLLSFALIAACHTPTYHGEIDAVIADKCGSCHQAGGIAPFALTSYDDVQTWQAAIKTSVKNDTMPPWPPSSECNDYDDARSLTATEKQTLLTWLDKGIPQGDPAKASAPQTAQGLSRVDLSIGMAEPYVAQLEPDDYRCFILDWPETETRFITGFTALPGDARVVHHVIAFAVSPDLVPDALALDEKAPGPGYPCVGGPGVGFGRGGGVRGGGTQWLAAWAPGSSGGDFPEGTGLKVEPGSKIILQMHYNSLTAGVQPDQTKIDLRYDSSVEKQAFVLPFANPAWLGRDGSMKIPAGEADVSHVFSLNMGLLAGALANAGYGEGFLMHTAGLHMHQLGTRAKLTIAGSSGKRCAIEIPKWDFHWQGSYRLKQPIHIKTDDVVTLECHWDNSAANQAVVNGELQAPADVEWGEETRDEMCLAVMYLTKP